MIVCFGLLFAFLLICVGCYVSVVVYLLWRELVVRLLAFGGYACCFVCVFAALRLCLFVFGFTGCLNLYFRRLFVFLFIRGGGYVFWRVFGFGSIPCLQICFGSLFVFL